MDCGKVSHALRKGSGGLAFATTLLFLVPAAAQDADTVAGKDAAVRSDWVAACQAFAKVKGDPRTGLRLGAARARAAAALGPAITRLIREKRWDQLAEVAACGRALDAHNHRYTAAAKRAAKGGVAKLPVLDARLRPWATYGAKFGEGERLLQGCLDYLVKTQEEDGRWSCAKHGGSGRYDVGVTALALLALLPYRRRPADRAAAALLATQGAREVFGRPERVSWPYNHALALEALAEYAVAAGKVDTYRDVLTRAADYLVDAQNPGAGWGYGWQEGKSDTSVTMRAVAALRAVEKAGVTVDPDAYAGARAWVESMTDENFCQIGYNFRGGASARLSDASRNRFPENHTQAMTAAGWLAWLMAGKVDRGIGRGIGLVHITPPEARYPDMYYWAAGARVCVAAQGRMPERWYAALLEAAKGCRTKDGGMRACGPWGGVGGRIYAAAITALALSAPCLATVASGLRASRFLETGKRSVDVAGWEEATPTGIYVESGMLLKVEAKGRIYPYDDGPVMLPGGTRGTDHGSARRRLRAAPLGCLLGRIDDGKPFVLKRGKNTLRGYGHLWLLCNEKPAKDNYSWWVVTFQLLR